MGQAGQLRGAGVRDLLLVAVSGLVGLTIGDTALFASVARIGAHRAVLIQTLAPIVTVILAVATRGESLGGGRLPGMLVTLAGVALVLSKPASPARAASRAPIAGPEGVGVPEERTDPIASAETRSGEPESGRGGEPRSAADGRRPDRGLWAGVALGLVAAVCQGTGVVLAKAGMSHLTFLPASFLRLGMAAVGLIAIEAAAGRLGSSVRRATSRGTLARIVPAAILGSYIGISLMMAGIERAPASVAAVLLATTPVFSLMLDAVRGQERLTLRGVAGTALAIGGIALISR